MSVFPYYDVWCDGPGPAGDGCDDWCRSATGPTVREARRLAREAGWVHRRGVGDLCPDCARLIDERDRP